MIVRDLAWGDFTHITENYYALYDEVREDPEVGILLFPERPSLGEESEWFSGVFRQVQEGRGVAAVAEEDGRVVGMCHVQRKGEHREVQHRGLLGILVARGWRDRGVGRALLRYTIDRCRGKFTVIELSVFVVNERARALYRSFGFKPWGVFPKAILRDGRYLEEEHMSLELPPAP